MSAIDAAAMWVDANISFSAARTIIQHLKSSFKHRIQVPFSQIQQLSQVTSSLELALDMEQLLKTEKVSTQSYGYESYSFVRLNAKKMFIQYNQKLHLCG